MVGDKDSHGYNEHTLPLLVQLIDSSAPDARQFTHTGVVAYFLRSVRAITAIEEIISRAENLRDTDERFATLGIGLAHGQLLADFDWLGRVRRCFSPLGDAANRASADLLGPQMYREVLTQLHETQAT